MKVNFIIAISLAFSLSGCGPSLSEINSATDFSEQNNVNGELSWDFSFKEGSKEKPAAMAFRSHGFFLSCIEGQAFVATTRSNALNVTPIMDSGKYIHCKNSVTNMEYRLIAGNDEKSFGLNKIGGLAICVGGYSFVHLRSDNTNSDVVQLFNEDGKAKFCMPKNMDLYKNNQIPVMHPELSAKVEAIEQILKKDSVSGNEKKIF
ncbi:MAG: hypothetical protein RSN61_21325 [Chryseobacterium sp.]|uniref:hypothetical protein n=1 Tax=Chryseobacterium sp. TaxID=1871047 RepID=UPI002FC5FBD0